MPRSSHFRRLGFRGDCLRAGAARPDMLLDALQAQVAAPFRRITGRKAELRLWKTVESARETTSKGTREPGCSKADVSLSCWARHVKRLRTHGDAHWHRCERKSWCAAVPTYVDGQIIAVWRISVPCEEGTRAFRSATDVLLLLVRQFEHSYTARVHPDALDRVGGLDNALAIEFEPQHPQVRAALTRIRKQFTDPNLSVAGIAADLDICPTYLAHLFSEQVGIRMSRYIARCRVERAKELLATTDWPVKRVAIASGHHSRAWFSHVFHKTAGVAPIEFRRSRRDRR